ncbi:MAG: HlyD family type I secretion periplasmic adaptor subunit [Alphaproteobacteria bacterium]
MAGGFRLATPDAPGGAPPGGSGKPPVRPGGLPAAPGGDSSSLMLDPRGLRRVVAPARFADFLPDAQAVAARTHSPFYTWLMVSVAAFFFVGLAWAAIAEVDKVATAEGRVRPDGQVKVINHPEGGRVVQLFIQDGDRVAAGQALLEFDPELIDEEAAKLESDWLNFSANVARLEAESVDRKTIEFSAVLRDRAPQIVAAQNDLFTARRERLRAEREAADQVMRQREEEMAALDTKVKALEGQVALLDEQNTGLRELAAKGYFSRIRLLAQERELIGLRGEYERAQDDLAVAIAKVGEARELRRQVDQKFGEDVYGRLVQARQDMARAAADLAKARSRQKYLALRAPVDGVVQNLTVHSIGQSIGPNEPIMNIVPTGDTLIIEARISNADIGYVEVGQVAEVKVNTYDFTRYGTLDGVVERISADATEDQQSKAFNYTVTIRTDRAHLGATPKDQPVVPGMQVQADLKIGRRTILSFLTDRVLQTTSEAFRER